MNEQSAWSVIGHTAVLSFFDIALKNDSINHGYIFEGPESVGKTTVATQLFCKLLGVSQQQLSVHPDFIVVERNINPKTNKLRELISIDQIKRARERFQRSTLAGSWKLMLIKDAHLLSESASNALLKTLEEPLGNACIVLTTNHASNLLHTIRSRSQTVSFKPVSREQICDAIVDSLGSRDMAHTVAGFAGGRPGVALSIISDQELSERFKEDREKARACLTGDASRRILSARNLLPEYNEDHVVTRTQLLRRVDMLQTVARDDLLRGIGCGDLVADQNSESQLSTAQATRSITGSNILKKQLAMHINPKMALINLMINIG